MDDSHDSGVIAPAEIIAVVEEPAAAPIPPAVAETSATPAEVVTRPPNPPRKHITLAIYQDVVSLFGHQFMAMAVDGPTTYLFAADQPEGPLTLVARGPTGGGLQRLSSLATARLAVDAGDQLVTMQDDGTFTTIGDWLISKPTA